jgi:hypothetical protein
MRRQAAFFPIVFALVAIVIVPRGGAQAQDGREEGPIEIEKCQTISQPGSYKLVKNLTFTGSSGACLMITASGVTLDLAGFTISGRTTPPFVESTAILGSGDLRGIAVQNGSVSGFQIGVDLGSATGSLVEKLRVFNIIPIITVTPPNPTGIIASGIVRSNAVFGSLTTVSQATGIFATGTLTGNYVTATPPEW